MEIKNQNKKLQELANKMETLKEVEKGKLKGGFQSITAIKDPSTGNGNNGTFCQC